MTTLVVPALDLTPWPTLGAQVTEFIHAYLVHGPGDLRGKPVELDQEKQALIHRMYEVFPEDHPQAGRRRFKRVALSLRKGTAKTELAALIAACELHPDGPVRCDHFENGQPVGRGVTDPYIPMVAYTEEQSDELAYAALKAILEGSDLARDFDIGMERIMRIGGDGRAVSLASAPSARDGARTTFQLFDETHRLVMPNQRRAHQTMLANIPKRYAADAWSLETTTAPAPGEGSIAEDTMNYARAVAEGRLGDTRLFFFHRQASDKHDLSGEQGMRDAVIEASGPTAVWSDIDSIVDLGRDPTTDRAYWERVWLNRPVQSSERAFDVERWKELIKPNYAPYEGALITLGFDGSRWHDATGIVATEVASGFQWLVAGWEAPPGRDQGWEVPEPDVHSAVDEAFRRWQVWRLYGDPFFWESQLAAWSGAYGADRVVEWRTNRWAQIAYAVRGFASAFQAGEVSHDGDADLARHIGNAHKHLLNFRDDQGERLWVIQKERPDSPFKIDYAMAAILSWQARTDAVASGEATSEPIKIEFW